MPTKAEMKVQLVNTSADLDRQDADATNLLAELRELNLDLQLISQNSSFEGAKDAGQAINLGQIILSLVASGGVVVAVIGAVKDWLLRNRRNKVVIELNGAKLEIDAENEDLLQALIEKFLDEAKVR